MNHSIFFLMVGALCAAISASVLSPMDLADVQVPALARKTGGASERLLKKQQERRDGESRSQTKLT